MVEVLFLLFFSCLGFLDLKSYHEAKVLLCHILLHKRLAVIGHVSIWGIIVHSKVQGYNMTSV